MSADDRAQAQPPSAAEVYAGMSHEARGLLWDIMNGPHPSAYRAKGTPAEAEALAAGAIVDGVSTLNGDACLWVMQAFATLAGGPRDPRPDQCTALPRPSCSLPVDAS